MQAVALPIHHDIRAAGFPGEARTGVVCLVRERIGLATDAPFAPQSSSAKIRSTMLEPFPHAMHQHHSFPGPEAPSTDWSHPPLSRLAPRVLRTFSADTGLCRPGTTLGILSRPQVSARLNPFAGYSPAVASQMPPIGFCNWSAPRTHLLVPQTSISHQQASATSSSNGPRGTLLVELPQPRDCGHRYPTITTPATARRTGFTPTCVGSDTSCQELAPGEDLKTNTQRPRGYRPRSS
jgi:hypothetical protein